MMYIHKYELKLQNAFELFLKEALIINYMDLTDFLLFLRVLIFFILRKIFC